MNTIHDEYPVEYFVETTNILKAIHDYQVYDSSIKYDGITSHGLGFRLLYSLVYRKLLL